MSIYRISVSYVLIARLIHRTDRILSFEGIGPSFISRRNIHSSLVSVRCTCPINQHNTNYHSRGSCVRFSVSWKSALNKSARMKTIKPVTVSREKYRCSCFHESIYAYNIMAGKIPFAKKSYIDPRLNFNFSQKSILSIAVHFIFENFSSLRKFFRKLEKNFRFTKIVFFFFFEIVLLRHVINVDLI